MTLFVTQAERLSNRYGADEWALLLSDLTALSVRGDIKGRIISIPISKYQDWDLQPYNVDAANQVTAQIKTIIQNELSLYPSIKYVVLVGNDDGIPYHRVIDVTIVSNERAYLMSSFLKPGSPIFHSISEGYYLTEDYYVDANPVSWQGRYLYIPDLTISRLVESPAEIRRAIAAFVASNGAVDPQTALVTAYDFFKDAGRAVEHTLESVLLPEGNVSALISDSWSVVDLRSNLLNQRPDISSANAHFTHYAALAAAGFAGLDEEIDLNEVLTSDEVGDIDGSGDMTAIVFSMGCHAGLSIPDLAAPENAFLGPGISVNPSLDFPQAMTNYNAIYLASTGYAVGDTDIMAGAEKLISILAEEMLQGDVSVGDALVAAKQRYLMSINPMTVYDEKTSTQFALFGLPQYRIQTSAESTNLSLIAQQTSEIPDPIPSVHSGKLRIIDPSGSAGAIIDYTLQGVGPTEAGYYFTADYTVPDRTPVSGDAQATAFRPIQPRIVYEDLPSDPINGPVHGVLLLSGQFTDLSEYPFNDPVVTRLANDWDPSPAEFQVRLLSFWPSELAAIKNLETIDGDGNPILRQTLVVLPGQFRATSSPGEPVTGIQRLYIFTDKELTFELLRSTLPDYEPPTVSNLDLSTVDATTLAVTVEATDDSGIARIVVLRINGGVITSTTELISGPSVDNRYTVNISTLAEGERMVVTVVDGAGNTTSFTGKGANISQIRVDAGPDQGYALGEPVNFKATVFNFAGLTPPVSYIWSFGDGTSESGLITDTDYVLDGDGNASFTVPHIYAGDPPQAIAELKVTDSDGGVGVDTVRVTIKTVPIVSLVSSDNPSIVGQPVIFTASVSADESLEWPIWVPTPTGGTVTFSHDGTDFATVPVTEFSEGVAIASVEISSLDPGWHTITATYSGDVFFLSAEVTNPIQQHVQYNLDTSLLNAAVPGAPLTITVSLDDGTEHSIEIWLK
jgi:uncharacterized protein (UPF0248 family)